MLALLLCLSLLQGMTGSVTAANTAFTDIPAGSWYAIVSAILSFFMAADPVTIHLAAKSAAVHASRLCKSSNGNSTISVRHNLTSDLSR